MLRASGRSPPLKVPAKRIPRHPAATSPVGLSPMAPSLPAHHLETRSRWDPPDPPGSALHRCPHSPGPASPRSCPTSSPATAAENPWEKNAGEIALRIDLSHSRASRIIDETSTCCNLLHLRFPHHTFFQHLKTSLPRNSLDFGPLHKRKPFTAILMKPPASSPSAFFAMTSTHQHPIPKKTNQHFRPSHQRVVLMVLVLLWETTTLGPPMRSCYPDKNFPNLGHQKAVEIPGHHH